jgi:hypothetical protein
MSTVVTSRIGRGALFSALAGTGLLLVPSPTRAEQFTLIDQTFTFTYDEAKDNNSHYYGSVLNPEQPTDWTSPVDYRNGSIHIRAEIIDKPEGGEVTQWVLCYIANVGIGDGYGCAGTGTYTEEGVIDVDRTMDDRDFWQNQAIDWKHGIKEMHLVLKDSDGSTGFAHKRPAELFFPTTVRITMVQVAEGSTYDPSLLDGPDPEVDAGADDPSPPEPSFDAGTASDAGTDANTTGNTMGSGEMNGSSGNGNTDGNTGATDDESTQEPAAEDASGCSVGTMGTTASQHVGVMALGLSALIARARPRKRNQST